LDPSPVGTHSETSLSLSRLALRKASLRGDVRIREHRESDDKRYSEGDFD